MSLLRSHFLALTGKPLTVGLLFLILLCVCQASVQADPLVISGTTSLTFTSTGTNQLSGLTYNAVSFTGTFASPAAGQGQVVVLSNYVVQFQNGESEVNDTHTLHVSFDLGTGTMPSEVNFTGNTYISTAALARLNFGFPQHFSFSNSCGSGTFIFSVPTTFADSLSNGRLFNQQTASIILQTFTPAVPESTTLTLLGTGLVGVGAALCKRRKGKLTDGESHCQRVDGTRRGRP